MEPQTWTVTVRVYPGEPLGFGICEATNRVTRIGGGGEIEALNEACPGYVAVGDVIFEVEGQTGNASQLVNSWTGRLDSPEWLHLRLRRPVEFDIHVDLSSAEKLGLNIEKGDATVTEVQEGGSLFTHNALQGPTGAQYLRIGDQIVQVNGREPPREDDGPSDVLAYLRLAVASGLNPLTLRLRRGEYMPLAIRENKRRKSAPPSLAAAVKALEKSSNKASSSSTASFFPKKSTVLSYLPSIFKPSALRSFKANLVLGRSATKVSSEEKWLKEPLTVSTTYSSKSSKNSTCSTPDRIVDADDDIGDHDILVDERKEALILPGVVARVPYCVHV